jgi:hypothetical protein
MKKIFVFHTTLMIVFNIKTSKFEIKTTSSFKFHINNLSKSLFHWKDMLRYSHAEKFIKVAQMKYNVIETKKTWKIVDKQDDYKLISLKWIFIYKFDLNDFFFKYKVRIVIRDDLQKVNNVQNVYAATFASKIFLDWSQNWISNMSNSSIRFNSKIEQKFLFDESNRILAIVRRSNSTREIVRNLRLDKIK